MRKSTKKVERKTQSKISCHYTWLLHAEKLPVSMTLTQKFFNRKQAQSKVNHCSKIEEKRRKRKGEKKIPKIEKPKDVGHFLLQKLKILIFAHARVTMH